MPGRGERVDEREPFELPTENAERLVQLLAGAVVAVIRSGGIATGSADGAEDVTTDTDVGTAATGGTAASDGGPPINPLLQGDSACSNFLFEQADPPDLEQEEDL